MILIGGLMDDKFLKMFQGGGIGNRSKKETEFMLC